jgi:RimJ/RimL family protein N-acetyltransferase
VHAEGFDLKHSNSGPIVMFSLQTARLILRPFHEADLPAFAAYRSDPEVARYQSWEAPYSLAQAALYLEELKLAQPGMPGEWFAFAIERQSATGILGDCAFQVLASDPLQAQIGYTLAREHWKQGYAVEAVQGLLDYLFQEFNLHRITATCDAENTASFQLLERVGMRREAHFIENIWFKGSWGSEYAYGILRSEWSLKHG